jgi:hypothetical protein
MNERISKIAQETDAWCDKYYFGDKFYDIEWETKFAELIVQECCNQLREIDAMAIRKHFGVEE